MPSTETVTVDEEQTVQHDVPTVRSPIFSSALAKERERASQRNSAVLKLITIIVVGLVIVALGLFVLTRSDSRMGSVAAAPPANPDMQSIPVQVPDGEVKNSLGKENTPQLNSIGRPEDVEFKRLREKRIAAIASDRLAIVQAFVKAENQYPNDYRFPYERAKLTIGPQSHSHDEAFDLLTLAAEKAVNSGKAHEMLDSLEVDKGGDFHKLSHGHREWTQLTETLKDKDTKPLARR